MALWRWFGPHEEKGCPQKPKYDQGDGSRQKTAVVASFGGGGVSGGTIVEAPSDGAKGVGGGFGDGAGGSFGSRDFGVGAGGNNFGGASGGDFRAAVGIVGGRTRRGGGTVWTRRPAPTPTQRKRGLFLPLRFLTNFRRGARVHTRARAQQCHSTSRAPSPERRRSFSNA